ncbi:MAG TPA: hypothetical protein VL309_01605 [Vicinamibacterales bacterium]|nr:hypothetical protein [Vicinamibacterales bacterium]
MLAPRPFWSLLALAGLAAAQPAPGTAGSRTVLATVSDMRNRAIVDLGVDDFVVNEGGRAREVLDVHVADYPIVLLVDNGGAALGDWDAIRKAAARFIARIGQRPLVLGTIGDPPALLNTFEDDRSVATARLDALTALTGSDSMVFQAGAAAAEAVRRSGAPFASIVVISASATDASRLPAEGLLQAMLDSGAIVHVIARREAGTSLGRGAAHNADLLQSLARRTHGESTTIFSAASYQVALDRLADRLSSEVMIQYIVPADAAAASPGDVKVGVRLPGARVHGLGVR